MEVGMEMVAVCAVLVVFGIGYNWLVERIEADDGERGYLSLLVVGGVLITLGAYALLRGIGAGLEVALLFAASGTPMIVGSIAREMRDRRQVNRRMREWVSGNTQDHRRV